MNVSRNTFTKIAAVLFLLIGTLQLARVFYGWKAVIGDVTIPIWASIIATLVALTMSYCLWKEAS